MTKEEKIKEAYGEYWDLVKDYVERNGWITVSDLLHLKLPIAKIIDCEVDDIEDVRAYRPKSLRGIENNNGWTKIETKEDLPEQGGEYDVVILGKIKKATYLRNDRWLVDGNDFPETTIIHCITHYQQKIKRELPLH